MASKRPPVQEIQEEEEEEEDKVGAEIGRERVRSRGMAKGGWSSIRGHADHPDQPLFNAAVELRMKVQKPVE